MTDAEGWLHTGDVGYMNEYPIAQLFRDSRMDTIHGGASEVMKLIIARSL